MEPTLVLHESSDAIFKSCEWCCRATTGLHTGDAVAMFKSCEWCCRDDHSGADMSGGDMTEWSRHW